MKSFRDYPTLWVFFGIYLLLAALFLIHLFSRKDCLSCTTRTGLIRSALLAAVITPSLITDFFVSAIYAPALMGFLFVTFSIPFNSNKIQLLSFALVAYILPWIACTLLIFGGWFILRSLLSRKV
jgi:hypothetical protein